MAGTKRRSRRWPWVLGIVVILAAALAAGAYRLSQGSVTVQLAPGWDLDRIGILEHYAISPRVGGPALLMFSKWSTPMSPQQIPAEVRSMTDDLIARTRARKDTQYPLASEEYEVEPFAGEHCSGSYAILRHRNTESIAVVLMMTVDGHVWSGQYTGPGGRWDEALTMLKGIRKRD